MKSFLDQLAEEILGREGNDFSDLCVVLPNRRAGVFLRDALSRAGKRTIWAPSILSIEDFVFRLSGSVKAEQVSLLFKLYEVYTHATATPQPFEQFANWAPIFLADINEVDMNLVDAEDIYAQLYSVERIARWNPSGKPMTDFQKDHLEFVKGLFPLYQQLRARLQQEKLVYQGMAFRHVAENAGTYISTCQWKNIWFAGFNALTVSEEHIIKAFEEAGVAKLFWDVDAYYVNDQVHEAGHYFRKYASGRAHLKVPQQVSWKQHFLSDEQKDISLIAAQRNVTQAQVAANILSEKVRREGPESLSKVAVVLNDEKLLFPLLNAIPEHISGVNITMGYGLKHSQVVSFVEKLFHLYGRAEKQGGKFYHADVLSVVTHPVFVSISTSKNSELKETLIKLNRSYLSADDLRKLWPNELLFEDQAMAVEGFIGLLRSTSKTIRETWNEQSYRLELSFVVLVERILRRMDGLQKEHGVIDSIRTLQVFWHQLINGQQLDFVGEPIGGLQVMGMLETRNLDFEEVIMLSVNEGSLPSGAHSPSYFTFDVRRAFGLACQNERDAVTAYHFYRLLQRAEKAYLIYDQDTESFGGGEVSRYVQQLQMEAGANIRFKEWRLEQKLPKAAVGQAIVIPKSESEFEKLKAHAERGFSPSALNTYRSCALKFYMRYVAKFKEQEEMVENVDHAQFGTAIHDTLETLYQPYLGQPLSKEDVQQMRSKADDVLAAKFAEHVPKESVMTGTNLLAYEVAKTYVQRVLDLDKECVESNRPNTVLKLEQKFVGAFPVQSAGETIEVHLEGTADRIDRTSNGTIRLIDYKTGSAKKLTQISDKAKFGTPDSDYAFQLLVYHWLYSRSEGNVMAQPSIFFLRLNEIEKQISISDGKVELEGEDLRAYTEQLLSELFEELFNPEVPFTQTEDEKRCEYCDFKQMCQR